jgi:signal transduction histidine kinase
LKLLTKLTLFITLSKAAIVVLFVLLLPFLVDGIAFQYTNHYLREQKKKVLKTIDRNGIDYYLQGEDNYGSYTMLKEEYIALEPVDHLTKTDTIETSRRIIEQDTLNYRVLSHGFSIGKKNYLLEIGKTTATISQYNRSLQRVALYVLSALILITVIIDLVFTRYMLRPLGLIIRSRLVKRRFPFNEHEPPVKTSTEDFKYLDRSLVELMDQVSEAFAKEREFTSNASHELMTPISILQTKLENLMMEKDMPEAAQHRVMEMMNSLNRLKKIMNALLYISRIENEQFAKSVTVSPSTVMSGVVADLDDRIEEKRIHLSLQLSKGIHIPNLNPDLLFQLFYNLVNNAIRYNKTGGNISISDASMNDGSYCITITDTGSGIDTEDVPHIFNRFRKSGNARSEGYGLGLAIVKSIVNFLGLEISVSSRLHVGTAFSIVFPAAIGR